MVANAAEAASLMKMLANERRLLILCHLIAEEEMSVGDLTSRVGLSQSALSQHLAKLRDQGLVTFRREAQTLFYKVSDERAAQLLLLLHEMYCSKDNADPAWKPGNARQRPERHKGPRGERS
jgi:DNA-binding transcriptional ArsR family regulator